MAERENYCYLLGLNPLKESAYKPEDIKKKIDKCLETWQNDSRNKQNDTEKRFTSQRLVESEEDIRRVMNDPILRKKEFADGLNLLKGRSSKLVSDCVILSDGKKVLLPGSIEGFMKKLRWGDVKEDDVIKLAGVSKDKPPEAAPVKILNAYKGLRTVDAYTHIELLNRLISISVLEISLDLLTEGSSNAQIKYAFDTCDKRVNSVRQDILPDQDSYINCLRNIKLILDDDKMLKQLIAYGKCNKELVPIIDSIDIEYSGRALSRSYIDELLRAGLSKGTDPDLAIKILQQVCYKRKIIANFSNTDSTMGRCPHCNCMVPSGPSTMHCTACGKELKSTCPSCGTVQSPNNSVCMKCGFNFKEGMQKANILALNINSDISRGMILKAAKSLAELEKTYPRHPNITSIRNSIEKANVDLTALKKLFNEAYSQKRFAEAKKYCDDLTQRFPEVLSSDVELKHNYADATSKFESADQYFKRSAIAPSVKEAINLCITATSICPDHPGARNRLKGFPPAGPEDAQGKLENQSFRIQFVPPAEDKNVTYCIYRGRGSLVAVDEDTRPLAEISDTIFEDRNMEPGVPYHYSVYSKRWGVMSRDGCHLGPVTMFSEAENISIDNIDGGLRITYKKPRGCTRVRVWRSENSKTASAAVELALHGEEVYDDIGLKGGKEYAYLFVAEYNMHGRVERSNGVVMTGTPINTPAPVKDMKIRWNKEDGTFTAIWSTEERVVLFASNKRIQLSGTLIKMSDLESWMKPIQPLQLYNKGIKFSIPDGSVVYLYPIIPIGNMGVRGYDYMLGNLRPFRDVEKIVSNRDCILTMIWPPDAIAAKLVMSDTGFKGENDSTAETLFVRREEYQRDKQIRIPMGRSDKKFINLYAMYDVDGKNLPSHGIGLEVYSGSCKKVHYAINKTTSSVDITADPDVTSLPPIVAIKASAGIPLKRTDGEAIWNSGGPVRLAKGLASVPIPAKWLSDPSSVRIFFVDDGHYNMYRFVHPLYGRGS